MTKPSAEVSINANLLVAKNYNATETQRHLKKHLLLRYILELQISTEKTSTTSLVCIHLHDSLPLHYPAISNWSALYYWLDDIEARHCRNIIYPLITQPTRTPTPTSQPLAKPSMFSKRGRPPLLQKGRPKKKLNGLMARNKRGKPPLFRSKVPERGTHRHRSLCVISKTTTTMLASSAQAWTLLK